MNTKERFNLAKRHKNFSSAVFAKLKNQNKSNIVSISTNESRLVYNWHRQVAGCYQRARAFSRLKISKHGIVYGKIYPEHFVEDLVARWFLSRFPLFYVLIESGRGTFIISKNAPLKILKKTISELLPKLESQLPISPILQDLEEFNEDDIWDKYYVSQYISQRKNKKYFLKNIPKKFHNWRSLKIESKRILKNSRLSDFSR